MAYINILRGAGISEDAIKVLQGTCNYLVICYCYRTLFAIIAMVCMLSLRPVVTATLRLL